MVGRRARLTTYLRLFILECPNPLDALESRSEAQSIAGIVKLIGHSVHTINTLSRAAFREACAYIGSICNVHDDEAHTPLCLHISAHGGNDGIRFGGNWMEWADVLKAIQPVLKAAYEGPRILVLSSCRADQQKLTDAIQKAIKTDDALVPPQYIFCAIGKVGWQEAAVGWTLFYHLIPNVRRGEKREVQEMLKKIASVDAAKFKYFRWDKDKEKYLNYTTAG